MRILHVTDHYLPVLGGIETHVAALANRQARRGDQVTVLTSTSSTADGQSRDDTGPVTVRRARSLVEGRRFDFASFDVVHAHISVVAPFSSPLTAMVARRNVPTVVTVHSLWNGMGPIPGTAAGIVGLRSAPVLWTSVSRVAADQLEAQLPRGTSVRVLPNAVDVVPRQRTPSPRRDRSVRLVSTMRIARRKRPLQLVRMFEALRRSVSVPVELTIVGDGPLRPRLEHRLARAGLADRVTVTGRLGPSAVLDVLAQSDLYVAPAVLESFGLAALEARCVGLPVLGHAASGMTEFVHHGVEGMLCRSDAEMVQLLRQLVIDNALRHDISEHNRTVSSSLTWAHALNRHDAAYALVSPSSRASSGNVLLPVVRS
ncbi:MAG: glycosyltransferase family 4 protein [Actinomycetota bacterium]|nr:glycosyltransferase family 4 protein [Actinomycetota bacterium]